MDYVRKCFRLNAIEPVVLSADYEQFNCNHCNAYECIHFYIYHKYPIFCFLFCYSDLIPSNKVTTVSGNEDLDP